MPVTTTLRPARRPLKIYASDPMLGSTFGNRISIEVPTESLMPGPTGSRIEVIDYDGANDRYYPQVNLEDPAILMQGGLEPSESDPRFHQQMVYAVCMRTIENFERALGRRIEFRRAPSGKLRVFPHAFFGANAFYDPVLKALLFGYFQADAAQPGANLPRQNVFTCLSHDIIAHETTHAIIDRLREHYMEPSNIDVMAFHEGFADIVALFQHFSFPGILRGAIEQTHTKLDEPTALVDLARQFGYASGRGRALRSALGSPSALLDPNVFEPHERGSILVAAVFDGFFTVYRRRIRDLVRLATGGTGQLPDGDLHPDLVNRVADEASRTAQQILTMCIRAFDYMPPVDITFGDFLRAIVTADFELSPDDPQHQREAIIEGFRGRSIYPVDVASLAEESLLLERAEVAGMPRLTEVPEILQELAYSAGSFGGASRGGEGETWDLRSYQSSDARDESTDIAKSLYKFAVDHADALMLDPDIVPRVSGFHPVFRVGPDGGLLIELVAQFTQQRPGDPEETGGLPYRGGTTVIAGGDGTIRYVIAKPLPHANLSKTQRDAAEARLARQVGFVAQVDSRDPLDAFGDDQYRASRMTERMSVRALHTRG